MYKIGSAFETYRNLNSLISQQQFNLLFSGVTSEETGSRLLTRAFILIANESNPMVKEATAEEADEEQGSRETSDVCSRSFTETVIQECPHPASLERGRSYCSASNVNHALLAYVLLGMAP